MAKGLKRPAAVAAEKRKKAKIVASALGAADVPSKVKSLLKKVTPYALGDYVEDRHGYQAKAISFVGDVLGGIGASLKEVADKAQAKVDGAGGEKASREKAVVDKAKSLALKKSEVAKRAASVVEAEIAHTHASEKLKAAEAAAKEPTKEFDKLVGTKTKLQALVEETWPAIKAAVAKDAKALSDFSKAVERFGVNSTLLETLNYALDKAPEARAEFDLLAIKNLDDALAAKMQGIDGEIAAATPAKTSVTQVVEAATAEEGKAKEALTAAKAAVTEGEAGVKAAQNALDAAGAALKSVAKDAAADVQALKDAQKKAAGFSEGPMAAFSYLKEMTKPPPPPVEVEAPPAETPAS